MRGFYRSVLFCTLVACGGSSFEADDDAGKDAGPTYVQLGDSCQRYEDGGSDCVPGLTCWVTDKCVSFAQ